MSSPDELSLQIDDLRARMTRIESRWDHFEILLIGALVSSMGTLLMFLFQLIVFSRYMVKPL